MPEAKNIALKIASLLPLEKEKAEKILAIVEDLIEWRGYSEELSCLSEIDNLIGSEETSPQ